MESFVAYLDILGTKDLVSQGKFSELHALDFTGAAFLAASDFPSSRFAAFSDCLIFSIPADKPDELIGILCLLFENWLSDGILVRGGIAWGDVQWVDYEADHFFHRLKNFSFARVYGKAVSEAVEIERSSGPGVLPFASEAAAERVLSKNPDAVFQLSSSVLRCFEWKNIDSWIGTIDIYGEHSDSIQARRHLNATKRVLKLFKKNKK